MCFPLIRKIFIIAGRRFGYYRRDRSGTLHDDISTRRFFRPWLLLLLVIPVFYFISATLLLNKSDINTQYYAPPDGITAEKSITAANKSNAAAKKSRTAAGTFQNNGTKSKRIIAMNHKSNTTATTENTRNDLPVCVLNATKIVNSRADVAVDSTRFASASDKLFTNVKKGGYYSPPSCISRHKVGILVPFRDRSKNLAVFLYNMHPFLMNQMLEYQIFVIEQYGQEAFNKGRLFNAGFKEMQKFGTWKCIVFHDVDLIPMDDRILYTCPQYARHMCGTVEQKKNDPTFHPHFGGVTTMIPKYFIKANGYSNMYWGWGGEDNDMFWRLRAAKIPVVRYSKDIARYSALPHAIRDKNRYRMQLLQTAMQRAKDEGLSTVEYKVVTTTLHHLYTHIVININPYNDNVTVIMRGY